MSQATNKKKTRPVNELDARDFIPVQYLCSLYSKDLLQGIFNEHVDEKALTVFVNSIRRSNNGPLARFGMEGAKTRVKALLDCVSYCATGEIHNDSKDAYTNIYAYLYTSKETDAELRLFQLKRWLKERGIVVKAQTPEVKDDPMVNNAMKASLQEFMNDRKLEVIVTLFEKLIRVARPKFTRVDVGQTPVESEEPIQYDSVVVGVDPGTTAEDVVEATV